MADMKDRRCPRHGYELVGENREWEIYLGREGEDTVSYCQRGYCRSIRYSLERSLDSTAFIPTDELCDRSESTDTHGFWAAIEWFRQWPI